MENKKNEKGITLIALIVTVIVLIIIASISTYSGYNAIQISKITKFRQELEIMQAEVDLLYEQNKEKIKNNEELNIGNPLEMTDERINKAFDAVGVADTTNYRIFDKGIIEELEIAQVDGEFLVSIKDREVISLDGLEIEGEMYYNLWQLTGNAKIQEGFARRSIDFEADVLEENEDGWKVIVKIKNFSQYVGKGIIQYQKVIGENDENDKNNNKWTTVEKNAKKGKDYYFNIKNPGKYVIRITDEAGVVKDANITINARQPVDFTIPNVTVELTDSQSEKVQMKAKEFNFEIIDSFDNVIATGFNDESGKINFPDLTFKEKGTYKYIIRQKQMMQKGIEYDLNEHEIEIIVNFWGASDLKVSSVKPESIKFINKYKPDEANVTLQASTVLNGKELENEMFEFAIKDTTGTIVDIAKNTKDGQIVFKKMKFDKIGEHKYTISQVNNNIENITYDNSIYTCTITITDNREGTLLAEVKYSEGKEPVFINVLQF